MLIDSKVQGGVSHEEDFFADLCWGSATVGISLRRRSPPPPFSGRAYRPHVDGGYYTVPEFSIYSLQGEWIMENQGVEPDIVIENLPGRMAKGYDDQLDAAIEYVMRKLEEDPKTLSPRPGPPAER